MATTQEALGKIIEQVPDADKYGLDLLKEKVEFLRDLTPQYIIPTGFDPSAKMTVADPDESPVYNQVVNSHTNIN